MLPAIEVKYLKETLIIINVYPLHVLLSFLLSLRFNGSFLLSVCLLQYLPSFSACQCGTSPLYARSC